MASPPPQAPAGAYGLRFEGVESAALIAGVPESWPPVRIVHRVGGREEYAKSIDRERARFRLRVADVRLDRRARTAEFVSERPLDGDELVHPIALPAAAIFAAWEGNTPIHAGGFVHAGRAWAVVGGKEAGKSTLLAGLFARGLPIVADDMFVVTPRATVLAGPRSIDLRADAAARVESWSTAPVVRSEERRRVLLDPIPLELPVGGAIVLEWGDAPLAEPLPPRERTQLLHLHRTAWLEPPVPELFLDLAALPAVRLRRPRRWGAEEDAIERLLAAVEAAGG